MPSKFNSLACLHQSVKVLILGKPLISQQKENLELLIHVRSRHSIVTLIPTHAKSLDGLAENTDHCSES